MIPIATPDEMAAIDEAAPEPVEELIERAGGALARTALNMLRGSYGRRVTVLAGKGNNGADGRAAARRLRRRGVRVAVVDAADGPEMLPAAHLAIDAAYGTGLRRPYSPPSPPPALGRPDRIAPILAADIPSGVDGLTGEIHGRAWSADHTVTFGALKPGLILHPGAQRCGQVTVASIGLDVAAARAHLVTAEDVSNWLPARPAESHKWHTATWVIAGSPGMTGAARLAASAALRGGSGYVRLSTPGLDAAHLLSGPAAPIEAVGCPLPAKHWGTAAVGAEDISRFKSMLVGPGLGRRPDTVQAVRDLVAKSPLPLVIDGDGLAALGTDAPNLLAHRSSPTVLTPHDGEYRVLTGAAPPSDRFAAARSLADATGAIVLLKGPTTVVANAAGTAMAIANGDARLATAGTGDVLAGLICGLLSAGAAPMNAAAAAAWLHGEAGNTRPSGAMAASDLLIALPEVWSSIDNRPPASALPTAWEPAAAPTAAP
ncbi:NAD(P)H-hydrate dehydratase [Candidatus Poriferisocius sp.]|uniref:NAD(P)H-hydrate dehydratase n=1 Tax=Candidatus Poriferisocius sp. TaxID=3101276 RepID=UPI003B02145D